MKLYICGPMSGMKDHNFPAFYDAEEVLIKAGYEVVNPATISKTLPANSLWNEYIKADIPHLVKCDGVAYLPGHSHSRGATLEIGIASALSIPCYPVHDWLKK
jgi:nucleoside 2-deoxyribosyltransferase